MKRFIQKVTTHQLVKDFSELFKSSEMDLSSIAVAYYMMLTIFPFTVLLANIFPYLHIDTERLLTFLKNILPDQLYPSMANIIHTIFNQPATGLVWMSILSALWSISKGVTYLQKALNKAYGQQDHRDFLLGRLIGMLIALLTILTLISGIVISTFGKTLLDVLNANFGLEQWLHDVLASLIQPITFSVFVLALGILYYLLPNVKIDKVRFIMPGTVFTSMTFLLVTTVFSSLVNRMIDSMDNIKSVGSIAIFVMMFWFIFFANVLIIGGIFNATYQKYRVGHLEPRQSDMIGIIKTRLKKR